MIFQSCNVIIYCFVFALFDQLSMERTETETRQRLNNKIEQLEKELTSMKTRLEHEVAQKHALGRTMDVSKESLSRLAVFWCSKYI